MSPRRLTAVDKEEALNLLGSVSVGRIVFNHQALPAIRPVNHIVDSGEVIIRTHMGAAVVHVADDEHGAVVAYEADTIDGDDHLGWSVIVTGRARLVHDPHEIARYRHLLRPWVAMDTDMDHVIRIHPELVTGFRLDGEVTCR